MIDKEAQIFDLFKTKLALPTNVYVKRAALERELELSLRENKSLVIRGQSGAGKTWLYKKKLTELSIKYFTTSCHLDNSIIDSMITTVGERILEEVEEQTSAKVKALIAEGDLSSKKTYGITKNDKINLFFKCINDKKERVIYVFDNLEGISEERAQDLVSIIMLIDDEKYPENLKLILVGAPEAGYRFFSLIESDNTIRNRVKLLTKEVGGLTLDETKDFIQNAFVDILNFEIDQSQINMIASYIKTKIDGLPQYVNEYCKYLATEIFENSNTFHESMLDSSITSWIKEFDQTIVHEITNAMNSRNNDTKRRNQVLYVLGEINKWQFSPTEDIELEVRRIFSNTKGVDINISHIFRQLIDKKILQNSSINPGLYEFRDRKMRVALRSLLRLNNEQVSIVNF